MVRTSHKSVKKPGAKGRRTRKKRKSSVWLLALNVFSSTSQTLTVVLPTERVMMDDETVCPGRNYILDGKVVRNEFPGTVKRLKAIEECREVRRYDRIQRALMTGMEMSPGSGAGRLRTWNLFGYQRGRAENKG